MKQTTNLKLNKPDYSDVADIEKINANSDILDREVNDRLSKTKGGTVEKDLTVSGGLTVNGTTTINGALKANALDKKADKVHTHSLTDNTITGTLPISKGGTGGATATDARTNLGLGNVDNTSDMNKPVSNAVQAALSSLRSDLTELQNSIKDKLPKGTTTYLFTPENVVSTAFTEGSKSYSQNVLSSPYYIQLKSCRDRTVWVGLYDYDENFLEAQKCKLKLMNISEHQECPTIGLETKPTRDIRLAVIDLGVYENTENTEGYCTIVDGLAPLGLI